jgi:colanic acid/amylovoran biosynthesis glycosyltransferase
MKIAFLVNRFPSLSEIFILNQITGLIDRGHCIDIYALSPRPTGIRNMLRAVITSNTYSDSPLAHEAVLQYNLLERVHKAPQLPANVFFRPLWDLALILKYFPQSPKKVIRALRRIEYTNHPHSVGAPHSGIFYAALPFIKRKKRTYDIVHSQFGPNGIRATLLRKLGVADGPLITSFRGYDAFRYPLEHGLDVYEDVFSESKVITCTNKAMKDHLVGLGCKPDKIQVLYSGVDTRQFQFEERDKEANEALRLLTVCRLTEKKGIEYALRALAQSHLDSYRYTIIGDGARRSRLERLATRLGIADQVTFTGYQSHDEVVNAYNDHHIFLHPSITASDGDQEGIPNSLKEAMATGMPVVATYHSGIPELVEDGVSGHLVPERDAKALSHRLEQLAENSQRWGSMGRAGRRCVENRFDTEGLNDQLVQLYQRAN